VEGFGQAESTLLVVNSIGMTLKTADGRIHRVANRNNDVGSHHE